MTHNNASNFRAQLHLHPEITNFNVGSCSVSPKPLVALAHKLSLEMAADPVGFIWDRLLLRLEDSRAKLADYLHVTPSNLILLENASFAINTLVNGLPFQPGDEVVITDQEYEHYFYLWRRLERELGIKLHTVTLPKATHMPDATIEDILTAFEATITPKTSYMMFSHVTAPTGLKLPAKQLTELGHKHEIKVIIDGAHTPGLLPLDISQISPDYYFGNLHKWLMGIPSGGFLYTANDRKLEPLLTSRYYAYDRTKSDHAIFPGGPTHFAANLEYHGTQDRIAQAILPELFAFRDIFGEGWLNQRMLELAQYTFNGLQDEGFPMISYANPDLATPMVTFKIPEVDPLKAWRWFRENKYEIAVKSLGPDKFIRLSLPAFIQHEDIDQLLVILAQARWDEMR